MNSPVLSDWNLIGTTMNVLQHCSAVHFFNGGKSAFLIKDDGLYAYGDNHVCTTNKTSNNNGHFVPYKITDLQDGIKALCTGSDHVTILDSKGKVFTWGSNEHGQLGDGNSFRRCQPYMVGIPTTVVQIACGSHFNLALDNKKEVWFWGRLNYVTDKFQVHRVPKHLTLPGNVGASQISCGSTFASIVTVENKVLTWGFNECGQLGHGHRQPIGEPREVSGMRDISGVLCATNSAIFLTKDGRVFITGRTGQSANHATPKEVKFSHKIVAISACWRLDQFGVKDESGEIHRWGYHDKSGLPQTTEFKDMGQIFSNKCTPIVYPENSECGDGLIIANTTGTDKTQKSTGLNASTKTGGATQKTTEKSNTPAGKNKKTNDSFSTRSYIEIWCDIKVRLTDGIFMAHSNVLRRGSLYLAIMLGMASNKKELDMTSFDAATCRTFFKYLYTNKLDSISMQYIPQLFQMAEGNQIQEKCMEMWHNGVTRRNVVSMYQLACRSNAERLKALCAPVICEHMRDITSSDEFKKLPNEVKLSLIATFHEGAEGFVRRLFMGM